MTSPQSASSGKVYLIGAGPGDPGLLTVRAVERLREADLVVYDGLINPRVLNFVPDGAETQPLSPPGGHGQKKWSQHEVHRHLVAAARAGKTVVRLKAGDPSVFGRVAEELEALRAAGVEFEVVPGVTAASAAAAAAGIPLGCEDSVPAVALVTGQESHLKSGPPLDYEVLGDFPGTLVLYMGVATVRHWTESLLKGGKPASTPVLIVRRCTWPDQQIVRATLGTAAEVVERFQLEPPAVMIVGQVAAWASQPRPAGAGPLAGTRVMVTRPESQCDQLGRKLADQGADVIYQPAIVITEPSDWGPVDTAVSRLDQYDWLVFSSANGVRFFIARLWARGVDLRSLAGIRIAAMGPGTARALVQHHLRADLVPESYRAEGLAAALRSVARGRRFLLLRASRGRQLLADQLRAAGAVVDQVVVYRSMDVEQAAPQVAAQLAAGQIDWVTVTSSAIARSLVRLFGDRLKRTRLASISPVTSGVLRELGYAPAAEADVYTMDGLVEAIIRHAQKAAGS